MGEGGVNSGWRLKIVHQTQVRYEGSAHASYNEVRMTPPTLPRQSALKTQVWTDIPVPIWNYRDYWGATVSSFDIQAPHHELLIRAQATVETSAAPGQELPLSWAMLRERAAGGRLAEYLSPTRRTAIDAALAQRARQRIEDADPLEAAAEIISWVGDWVAYVPGATQVQTSAQEAWDMRKGVCQDMAHLTVALLREVGLPARYVSGYLHPEPEAQPGDEMTGQSHAWVEYWAGTWIACDPTNRARVGERHVLVAAGRDYGDVPPLKGIYRGAPSSAMVATVVMTRVE
jgi:transglutaminase-like putative cysteine protease